MSDLMTESEDCQRCPWCNGEDVEVVDTVKGFYGFRIRCQNLQCRAEGPEAHTRQLAIAAWNTRQPAPSGNGEAVTVAIEALDKLSDALDELQSCTNPKPGNRDDWECALNQAEHARAYYKAALSLLRSEPAAPAHPIGEAAEVGTT